MRNKSINSNKQFMIGNGLLAFGVFFVVCLFLYLGFRSRSKGEQRAFEGVYTVEITSGFAGDSLSVFVNDSLLMNRTMGSADVTLQIERFAEESVLMVVDNRTENITPFNLNPKGSKVSISKRNGKVFIEEEGN